MSYSADKKYKICYKTGNIKYLNDNSVLALNGKPYELLEEEPIKNAVIKATFNRLDPGSFPGRMLFEELSEVCKFQPQLEGYRDPYTPIIRLIYQKRASINLDSIQSDAAWYSLPAFSNHLKFFYKSPQFQVSQTFFFDAFTYQFWLASLGLNLLIIASGWVFYRYLIKKDLVLILFIGIFVFSGQGFFHSSPRPSWRFYSVVLGTFSFVFLSVFNMFTSSLLTAQRAELPFTTIDEIAGSQYVLCMHRHSIWQFYFKNDKKWDKNFDEQYCPKQEFFEKDGLIVKFVCQNDRIVYATGNLMQSHIENDNSCQLFKIKGQHLRTYYGLTVHPNFRHKDQLNTMIVKMMTVGVTSRIQREIDTTVYYNFDLILHDSKQDKLEFQVEFRHVELILLGYLIMIVLCLFILLCEKIYFFRAEKAKWECVFPYLP